MTMNSTWSQPHGLRLTLRRIMIAVAVVAVLSAVASPLMKPGTSGYDRLMASLVLPFAPLMLAVFLFLFDRAGLVKFWLTGLLASLFLPAFVAWFDVTAWLLLSRTQWRVALPLVVGLNVLALLVLYRIFKRYTPGRCPECGRRAVIAIGRTKNGLRWCASCGWKPKA